MAWPDAIDDVDAAPSGNLGTTTPTHRQSHDQYRTALIEVKDYVTGYTNHGNTGTTETVTSSTVTTHRIVLDNNCTLTFATGASGAAYTFTLVVVQDGTGSRTITWPGSVDWAGGTAPTLSTGANKVDVFTFLTVDGGTTWWGFTAGLDMR